MRGMRSRGWLAVALLVTALVTVPANAESAFSSVGYGRWTNPVDARAAGMGDVSVVVPGRWSFAPRNPAAISLLPKAAGMLMFEADFTHTQTELEDQTRPDARLPLIGAATPLGQGFVGSVMLTPLADGQYDIIQEIPGNPNHFLRTKGKGTWTLASAALAVKVGQGGLGFQAGVPISSIDEEITREFTQEGFESRVEKTSTELDDAVFMTAGMHYRLWILGVGGFYQLPTEGKVTNSREVFDGGQTTSEYTVTFPEAYGAGASLRLWSITLAAEYRRHPWSEMEIEGQPWQESAAELGIVHGFKDIDAYGAGMEIDPGRKSASRSVLKHLRYRLGYSLQPWLTAGPYLGRVTDESATFGIGIPFERGNGMVDLAARYTRRREGESILFVGEEGPLSEDIISVQIGLSFAGQPRDF